MDVNGFMRKHRLSDADLDRMAEPYESTTFERGSGKVYRGSHPDAVGKRRITVVYDAAAAQRVSGLAKARGVKASDVYRDALDYYLASQA